MVRIWRCCVNRSVDGRVFLGGNFGRFSFELPGGVESTGRRSTIARMRQNEEISPSSANDRLFAPQAGRGGHRASAEVTLGLGSNLGDREKTLQAALMRLLSDDVLVDPRASGLYETAPIGPAQGDYLNAVVVGSTILDPLQILHRCQSIEDDLGRDRSESRWGPRTIDIDILSVAGTSGRYGDGILTLPHPEIANRRFVLLPWCELKPTETIPGSGGMTVRGLLRDLESRGDGQGVNRWEGELLC